MIKMNKVNLEDKLTAPLMRKIKGKHPYEDRTVTYTYIGSSECEGEMLHLYNTPDHYTVSLQTALKHKKY